MGAINEDIDLTAIERLIIIIGGYPSIREFARCIGEDPADVMRWRKGKRKINPRAVINICRLHPDVKPYQLNKSIFPENLTLKFTEKKK